MKEPQATNQSFQFGLGGIQQLRGQQGGEGGLAKSPRLSTQGGGVLLMSTWTEN